MLGLDTVSVASSHAPSANFSVPETTVRRSTAVTGTRVVTSTNGPVRTNIMDEVAKNSHVLGKYQFGFQFQLIEHWKHESVM